MKGDRMFYINLDFEKSLNKKFNAFSLVEVMLALVIIAIVIVLIAPVFTGRSIGKNRQEGVVFTYNGDDINVDNRCFIYDGSKYVTTNLCQEYEFRVPDGVDRVNLTLVAGGGGGGGASGGHLKENKQTKEFDGYPDGKYLYYVTGDGGANYTNELDLNRLRSIKINYMTGKGENGEIIPELDPDNNKCIFKSLSGSCGENNTKKYIQVGKGGSSSAAIQDFIVPENFYRTVVENPVSEYKRTFRFSDANVAPYYKNGEMRFYISETNNKNNNDVEIVTTYNTSEDDYNKVGIKCSLVGNNSCYRDIPSRNILIPQKGEDLSKAYFIDKNTQVPYTHNVNYGYLKGEKGGKLPRYGEYGSGGAGYPLFCEEIIGDVCTSMGNGGGAYQLCQNGVYFVGYSNNDKRNLYCLPPCRQGTQCYSTGNVEQAQNKYITGTEGIKGTYDITYIEELPGNPGSGGSGGGVIKINNMPVKPRDTYVIRVGKGGKGGLAGKYSTRNMDRINPNWNGSDSSTKYLKPKELIEEGTEYTNLYTIPTDKTDYTMTQSGKSGQGGVSTSIWKREDNGTETLLFLVSGGMGGYGGERIMPVYNGGSIQSSAPYYDPSSALPKQSRSIPFVAYNSENSLGFMDRNVSSVPSEICTMSVLGLSGNFNCLNFPKLTVSNVNNITPFQYLNYLSSESSSDVKKYGGFSSFENTPVTINNYLSSFYYKNISDNKIGYVGGLGGFTGFGTKAGCGGMFFGNPNGFNGNPDSPLYNINGVKKMFIPNALSGGSYRAYNVLDFYDNCSLLTPDGHSADFKLPNPKTGDVGQAGAGGGGGGYLMFNGAGNGGDGQDGYLMIDWRK